MKPNQTFQSKLQVSRQTINKLNETTLQQVKGGLAVASPTVLTLSAIELNCFSCIPGGVYCPTVFTFNQ